MHSIFQCYVYNNDDESEIELLGKEDAITNFSKITGGYINIDKHKKEESRIKDEKKIFRFFVYKFYLDKTENKKDNDNQRPNDESKSIKNSIVKLPILTKSESNNISEKGIKCKCFLETCKLKNRKYMSLLLLL